MTRTASALIEVASGVVTFLRNRTIFERLTLSQTDVNLGPSLLENPALQLYGIK